MQAGVRTFVNASQVISEIQKSGLTESQAAEVIAESYSHPQRVYSMPNKYRFQFVNHEEKFMDNGGSTFSKMIEQVILGEDADTVVDKLTSQEPTETPERKSFTPEQVADVATKLGLTFDDAQLATLKVGMEVELEHGSIHPDTNITDDDPEKTAKIALAHINERSDYYDRLAEMENIPVGTTPPKSDIPFV